MYEAFLSYHSKYAELRDEGLADAEIKERIGVAPWDFINELLKSSNFPYQFKRPKSYLGDYNVRLLSTTNSQLEVNFSDLSSGERVILSLSIWLFNASKSKRLPKLLLLDEPDAHLHPSAVKQFIDVIEKELVVKFGVRVIITTHSPTTVALAPSESIYEFKSKPNTSLVKISKNEALKLLTTELPNLSIDYENHFQVFVESPTDIKYYQVLFDKIYAEKSTVHRLYFISNGYGKSNSSQVKEIVASLRSSGNKTAFGIIDWDKSETSSETILVHASKIRYSIENFIFDPFYLSILLLELRYGELIKHISYEETDNQFRLIQMGKAQSAIDFVIQKLAVKYHVEAKNEEMITCQYGEHFFVLPKWFLETDGHKLKDNCKEVFQPLQGLRGNEYEIEGRLINIIAKMYPIIPKETKELLVGLSNYNN